MFNADYMYFLFLPEEQWESQLTEQLLVSKEDTKKNSMLN